MAKSKFVIPVKCGARLDLTVEDIASSGDGISRYNGYTLFIPNAIGGDRVFAEVIKTTPRFGVTRLIKLITPSPDRIAPECRVYSECGGCQLQHIKYDKQMEFKKKVLKDNLERIGKIVLKEDIEVIPAQRPFFYRNKGIFSFKRTRKGLKVGFFAKGTHRVIDIGYCPVLLKPINEVKEAIRRIIEKSNISVYNETHHKGFLRSLIIRESAKTKEILIGLITTEGSLDKKIIEEIAGINDDLKGDYKIAGIVQNINSVKTNIILGSENRLLWGRDYINESLGGIAYRLSLTSFFQINPYQTEILFKIVEDMLKDLTDTVLDIYSGIGSMALQLAKHHLTVIGIEENEVAVMDAGRSAERNNIKNCSFLTGAAEDILKSFEGRTDIKAVILDPPRKGCSEEVLNSLLKIKPEKIVYISCNPSTLSRDLHKLCYNLYEIKKVKIIDMFPQTVHTETVVFLKRKQET
ncbi:MAG: 23S rRNA (uracil(1939)-C(5))-methyltransferase RlmD [Nitrospinae bacterium]|nr:23S rRNA (uracil(1939)-C(5))-methyltransferase RlmD [Nitrospinota bacterium]